MDNSPCVKYIIPWVLTRTSVRYSMRTYVRACDRAGSHSPRGVGHLCAAVERLPAAWLVRRQASRHALDDRRPVLRRRPARRRLEDSRAEPLVQLDAPRRGEAGDA